ncbi:MAG: amiC 1, partial [Frankiales bacterium]|nr:amiC 1 [Frankiales bacterium]
FPAGADVVLTPVLGTPPAAVGALTGLVTLVGAGRAVPFTPPWNVSGHPAISVPAGWTTDGLPLAVQLVAAHGRDDLLLALAAQLQADDDWTARRPPVLS